MTEYKCGTCNKIFKRKNNLDYHVTNRVCIGKQYEIDENDDASHNCKLCGKGFTSATNMYRHTNHTCKVKKSEDRERGKIYERLLELEKKTKQLDVLKKENTTMKKENNTMKKKVEKMEKIITGSKQPNNITNNINNGIVAHINLVGYGKEDISRIDKKDLLRAIQYGYDSTIKLTEALHFNPNYPEYHNVYITNMKDKYAMMFDGKDWNLTMKDELINKIYDDKKNYIEENIDDFIDSLTSSRKKALERWLSTDDNDDRIIKIKNEIKLLLYNKRNVILDKQEETQQSVKKTVKKSVKLLKTDPT
jgi:hypothetical protein